MTSTPPSMAPSRLWTKLRSAQDAKNADAANAYRQAIVRANKDDAAGTEWWEKQGDEAMGETPVKVAK